MRAALWAMGLANLLVAPLACQGEADEAAPLAVASRCRLAASDAPVAADGLHAHVVDVVVRDDGDRPVAEQAVVLFGDSATLHFDQPPVTDANGRASGYAYASAGGNQWVRGALMKDLGAAAFAEGVLLPFYDPATPPAPAPSPVLQLRVAPASALADGHASLALTVDSHALIGRAVNWHSSEPTDVVEATSTRLADNAPLVASLRSTRAGLRLLRVSAGGLSSEASACFVAGPPAANTCSLALSPNRALADGQDSMQLEGRLADAFDNAVPGLPFSLTASGGNVTFGSNAGVSGDDGRFSVSVYATSAGHVTVEASAGGVALAADGVFTAPAGGP